MTPQLNLDTRTFPAVDVPHRVDLTLANLAPNTLGINIVNGLYLFVAEGYQEINSRRKDLISCGRGAVRIG